MHARAGPPSCPALPSPNLPPDPHARRHHTAASASRTLAGPCIAAGAGARLARCRAALCPAASWRGGCGPLRIVAGPTVSHDALAGLVEAAQHGVPAACQQYRGVPVRGMPHAPWLHTLMGRGSRSTASQACQAQPPLDPAAPSRPLTCPCWWPGRTAGSASPPPLLPPAAGQARPRPQRRRPPAPPPSGGA